MDVEKRERNKTRKLKKSAQENPDLNVSLLSVEPVLSMDPAPGGDPDPESL